MKTETTDEELLPQYDFSGGTRGQFAEQYARGTNVITLSPDVAAVFPDAEAVNEALRSLIRIARQQVPAQK